ncbi:MAG: hypothetical protein AB3N13_10170 [Arenibacterium sp.]
MRVILPTICAVSLMLSPVSAQQEAEEDSSMMERGMMLFLEGLREEMSPALRDLQGLVEEFGPPIQSFLREMGPAMADILEQVEDWSRYERPQILPNGDIIIRRKPENETEPKAEPDAPAGTTDI